MKISKQKIVQKLTVGFLVIGSMLSGTGSAIAATAINMGVAGNFAVLGGSTITNTGSTVINGDIGMNPGTSLTGFPPGTINGTQHITDATAAQAQTDLVTAFNAASDQTGATIISGDLGGRTLTAGTYNSASSIGLSGTLTLDGQSNQNSIFIFQSTSTLTTAPGSRVVLTNGAQACNVFWEIGSSVTLGTNSTFAGTLMALTSITATTGASVNGRMLARNGAVTLDTNNVSRPVCASLVTIPTPIIITPNPVINAPATAINSPTLPIMPNNQTALLSMPQVVTPIPTLPKTGFDPNGR